MSVSRRITVTIRRHTDENTLSRHASIRFRSENLDKILENCVIFGLNFVIPNKSTKFAVTYLPR
ncbi:hypothetical protein, partial [Bacteroides acidifaciens]|uniref:hypothetical protein n=1 Tax=Bacteroides acidifaciens TaxID=85831 RepID=UPI0026DF3EE4